MIQRPDQENSLRLPGIVHVAAGLVFRDHKLLLAQRLFGQHLGGLWEFPGGKLEPDETFEICLARELKEELEIIVAVGESIEEITHHYPEKTVHLKFFICRWREGEPRPIHCQNFAWVTRFQLDAYQFPAADARLIERLQIWPELWE